LYYDFNTAKIKKASSSIDEAPADSMAWRGTVGQRACHIYRYYNLLWVPLTEGIILEPCYEIQEHI